MIVSTLGAKHVVSSSIYTRQVTPAKRLTTVTVTFLRRTTYNGRFDADADVKLNTNSDVIYSYKHQTKLKFSCSMLASSDPTSAAKPNILAMSDASTDVRKIQGCGPRGLSSSSRTVLEDPKSWPWPWPLSGLALASTHRPPVTGL